MARGRKPNLEKTVSWHIHIRERVAAPVELVLADPLTGKVKAGARQALVEQLLDKWLDEQRRNHGANT